MIPIGELDQRVTFQDKVATRNEYGEEVVTWADGETVWAKAIPNPGAIRYLADQLQPETDAVFQIRYLATVTQERRMKWNGVQHEILSVYAMDGRRFDMEIQARSGLKHG